MAWRAEARSCTSLQQVLGSLVVGCVFLVSVALGRPMVESLALEFWPLTPDMLAHPAVVRLLRRLTFLWAGINLAIGASTLTLLVVLPLPLFVAVKQAVAWSITAAGIAITIDRSVHTGRRAGFAAEAPKRLRLELLRDVARAAALRWVRASSREHVEPGRCEANRR